MGASAPVQASRSVPARFCQAVFDVYNVFSNKVLTLSFGEETRGNENSLRCSWGLSDYSDQHLEGRFPMPGTTGLVR